MSQTEEKTANEITEKAAMKENELWDAKRAVATANVKLGQALLLLQDWMEEYCFNKSPDPRAAIKATSTLGGGTVEEENSAKWYWDYNRIKGFVEIASDCVFDAQKALNEVKV